MIEQGEEHVNPEKKEGKEVANKRVVLKVPSMHCEGCLSNIQDAVMGMDEVSSVEGNEQSKEIVVVYRGTSEVEGKIRKKIIDAGHVVSEEEAPSPSTAFAK